MRSHRGADVSEVLYQSRHSPGWSMRRATGISLTGSASGGILNEDFFETAGTVHFAALTAALLAGWMAVRLKASSFSTVNATDLSIPFSER
jgi:hypothetical protein